MNPELEICAETVQACEAAVAGGADRIEICTALDDGGLTPSHALLLGAMEAASGTPVHVLLRPRAGNFVYSDAEFRLTCRDLEHAAELGVSGFVVGLLTPAREIDEPRMRIIMNLARGLPVTFHRAVDRTPDLDIALERVIDLGCARLLTSGGFPTVAQGFDNIVRLAGNAGGRIRVAAGGGLTATLASQLRQAANVDLHASLRKRNGRPTGADPLWSEDGAALDISADDVRALAAILRPK